MEVELAGFEGLGGSFVRRAGAVVTGGLPVVDGLDVELAFFHFTDVADARKCVSHGRDDGCRAALAAGADSNAS